MIQLNILIKSRTRIERHLFATKGRQTRNMTNAYKKLKSAKITESLNFAKISSKTLYLWSSVK